MPSSSHVLRSLKKACQPLAGWDTRVVRMSPRSLKSLASIAYRKRPASGMLRFSKKITLVYKPLGVVGLITPWNGPVALAANPRGPAGLRYLAVGKGRGQQFVGPLRHTGVQK